MQRMVTRSRERRTVGNDVGGDLTVVLRERYVSNLETHTQPENIDQI